MGSRTTRYSTDNAKRYSTRVSLTVSTAEVQSKNSRTLAYNKRRSTVLDLANVYLNPTQFDLDNLDVNWWLTETTTVKEKKLSTPKIDLNAYILILQRTRQLLHIFGIIEKCPHSRIAQFSTTTLEFTDNMSKRSEMLSSMTLVPPLLTSASNVHVKKNSYDRFFIQQLISVAIKDLRKIRGIDNFRNLLQRYVAERQELETLLKANKAANLKVRRLSNRVDHGMANWEQQMDPISNKLGRVKDLYEDTIYENEIKHRYLDQWEAARRFQQETHLSTTENKLRKSIDEDLRNQLNEDIVHNLIISFNDAKEQDYWKQIQEWTNKYENDMNKMLDQINSVLGNRERQQENFRLLFKTYTSRKKKIDEYLVVRENRRKDEELYQKQCIAATKIQSWWRGVMVRRHLGPYRKKKGKKGVKSNVNTKKNNKKKK